jgi:predicted Zn-dependent peptidase
MKLFEDLNIHENIKRTVLDNGITLITDDLPYFQSVSAGFFLKRGSRDEKIKELGYSHFCEHMLFKGTSGMNNKEITREFDRMGGYVNAYTTHESIVLYNRVPKWFLTDNTNLFFNIFNDSVFDAKENELERNVILNEIKSDLEDPQDKVHEDFFSKLFHGQSLGKPVIGSSDSIKNANRNDLYDFYKRTFNRNDLIIVMSGSVDKSTIDAIMQKNDLRDRAEPVQQEKALQINFGHFHTVLNSEQVHVVLGTSMIDLDDAGHIRMTLLNSILGDSMSSIFFQKIREELGLCYSIGSFMNKYRQENVLGLYMSLMPKNVDKAIAAVSATIRALKEKGITEQELSKSKEQKTGEMIMNFDILNKRISRMAFMEMNMTKIYSLSEIIEMIRSTTLDDINQLIRSIFVKDNFLVQSLYKKKIKMEDLEF